MAAEYSTARYIEVFLDRAEGLPKTDFTGAGCDPYATINLGKVNLKDEKKLLGSTKYFKSSVKSGRSPSWGESFVFKDEGEQDLYVKLFDEDVGSDELICELTFPTKDISDTESKESTPYPLTFKKKPAGKLYMKVERFVDFRSLKERARQFREQMEQLQDDNTSLLEKGNQVDDLKRDLENLLAEAESANTRIAGLTGENEKLAAEKKAFEDQLKETADELEDVRGELNIKLAEIEEDADQDAAVEKRLGEIRDKYKSSEGQRKEAVARGDQIQAELSTAQRYVQDTRRQNEQQQKKLNDLGEKYSKERRQHERLRKEHRKLEREYEAATVSPAVVAPGAGSKNESAGGGSKRSQYNTYGEFMTGLGLVFVLFLHRSQNLN